MRRATSAAATFEVCCGELTVASQRMVSLPVKVRNWEYDCVSLIINNVNSNCVTGKLYHTKKVR